MTKYVIFETIACAITLAVGWRLFRPLRTRVWLTPNERKMRDLVRELYGRNIVGERLSRSGRNRVLIVQLQNESLEQLQVNLTSLAKKHRQGASLAALKTTLRF